MSALWDLSAFDPQVTGELGDIMDAGPYLKPSFPLLLSLAMRHIQIPTSSNCREHLSSFSKVPMTRLMIPPGLKKGSTPSTSHSSLT